MSDNTKDYSNSLKWRIVLGAFLILDLAYSFYSYHQTPLGGDLSEVVFPSQNTGYYEVLQDPLGMDALVNQNHYPNPNRYFAHQFTSWFLLYVPKVLHVVVSPIESVYLACAFLKIIVHIGFLVLFSKLISVKKEILNFEFLLIATLTTVFFQTSGYNRYMGIIDQSIVYTFFYAIPLLILGFMLIDLFKHFQDEQELPPPIWKRILLLAMIPVITLNGPLIPGIVLILGLLIGTRIFLKSKSWFGNKLPIGIMLQVKELGFFTFLLMGLIIFSIYSLYLGQFNSLNSDSIPLIERYLRIPDGLFYLLTEKIGYSILLLMLIVNFIVLNILKVSKEHSWINVLFKWSCAFIVLYILLLPLGGYRDYRENIIRYDTILPLTVLIIFLVVYSSVLILKSLNKKIIFATYLGLSFFIFTNADRVDSKNYQCERDALQKLSQAKTDRIVLNIPCPVMEWKSISDFEDSRRNARLFQFWGITQNLVLYTN